jgi:hypothetical protein
MLHACRKGSGLLFFPALPDGTRNILADHASCAVLSGTKYAGVVSKGGTSIVLSFGYYRLTAVRIIVA